MKMVCEGAYTIKALKNIIEMNNLNTPIFIELYNLLYEGTDVSTITETFMTRDLNRILGALMEEKDEISLISLYLSDIRNNQLLDKEEEYELLKE